MTADDPGPAPEEALPASPSPGPVPLARVAPFLPLLLAVVIFVPGLFGQFVWDDLMLIRGNAYVRDLSRLPEALTHDFWHVSTADQGLEPGNLYYRPVVTLAYAVQFQSFGEAPLGYHAVSLLLHLLCVVLAFVWLRRRVAAGPAGAAAALLGAALFAVHASRPESVSWVSGSTDLWMTALVLAGLLLWERSASRISGAAAVLCFGLAVLAKETALVVPLLLFADAWLLRDAGPERARALRRAALPLLGVAAVFALRLALVPLRSAADAGGVGEALPRVLSTAGHYLRALLWPWPPSVEAAFVRFDAGGAPVYLGWSVALGAAAVLGGLALLILAWRSRSLRPWLADAAWLVVPLLPALNVWPLGLSTLAPTRNLYLPLLGAAALAARAVRATEGRSFAVRRAVLGAGALAVAASALVSLYQISTLRDEDSLWTHEHAVAPDNPFAAERLALVRFQQGRYAEALDAIQAGWEASGGAEARRVRLALLAADVTLASTSDADQAGLRRIRAFYDALARGEPARLEAGGRVLELGPSGSTGDYLRSQPQRLLVPRGVVHARTLDLAEARRQLEEVVRRFPASVDGWVNLALVLARQERWDEARRAAQRGLAVQPDEARLPQILKHLETAQRLAESFREADPAARAMARAETLLAFGGLEQARRALEPVLAAHPDQPAPVLLRVMVDAADARFDLARRTVEEARQRMPAEAALWEEALRRIADEERAWRASPQGRR